ncbi:MAG TPA: nicotinamide riboside transporter PnuC [Bacteroidales bacterium]|nr:nicotinamide riboside transporter PnuC [Bacteroidales bacterium]
MDWIRSNYIEVFGALAGIVYVILEIRQNIWLWPVGILTSAVYIWVFFTSKFYADMALQVYYLGISVLGWYWWSRKARAGDHNRSLSLSKGAIENENGEGHYRSLSMSKGAIEEKMGRQGDEETGRFIEGETGRDGDGENNELKVSRINRKTVFGASAAFGVLYLILWLVLSKLTDSPVPEWDSFITSLSIVATWMLARKIYEHWYLWIVVNTVSAVIFTVKGLHPTVILYIVYGIMSVAGLVEWRKSLKSEAFS